MKKIIIIAITIAVGIFLFNAAGQKIQTTINNSTAKAQAIATMTASQ